MAGKKNDVIDLRQVVRQIKLHKKRYYIILPIVCVCTYLLVLCVPRYYNTDMTLAPEMENQSSGGGLSSIASSFGFDLGNLQTSDAINPMLYPDLMDDNGFVTRLFSVRVKSQDGTIDTDYYTYLTKHQQKPWWKSVFQWVRSLFPKEKKAPATLGTQDFNPYMISKDESDVCSLIRNKVKIGYDKKTTVVSISVEDNDPLICKTIADSVSYHLQNYITVYRTNKARLDVEYYEQMVEEARRDYDSIRHAYARYYDANTNVVLQRIRSRIEDMENEMQMKYNAYTSFSAQLQAARARVQERTPAFTTLKGASLPVQPAGPKRLVTAIGMTFLAFIVISFLIMKNYLFKLMKTEEEEQR